MKISDLVKKIPVNNLEDIQSLVEGWKKQPGASQDGIKVNQISCNELLVFFISSFALFPTLLAFVWHLDWENTLKGFLPFLPCKAFSHPVYTNADPAVSYTRDVLLDSEHMRELTLPYYREVDRGKEKVPERNVFLAV